MMNTSSHEQSQEPLTPLQRLGALRSATARVNPSDPEAVTFSDIEQRVITEAGLSVDALIRLRQEMPKPTPSWFRPIDYEKYMTPDNIPYTPRISNVAIPQEEVTRNIGNNLYGRATAHFDYDGLPPGLRDLGQ